MAATSILVVADEGRRLKACRSALSLPVVMSHSKLKRVVNFALGTPEVSGWVLLFAVAVDAIRDGAWFSGTHIPLRETELSLLRRLCRLYHRLNLALSEYLCKLSTEVIREFLLCLDLSLSFWLFYLVIGALDRCLSLLFEPLAILNLGTHELCRTFAFASQCLTGDAKRVEPVSFLGLTTVLT